MDFDLVHASAFIAGTGGMMGISEDF